MVNKQALLLLNLGLLFAATANARLKVLSPESLATQFKNSTIRANYANFGYFPFGQSLMGHLHYNATDSEVCDELDGELDRREDISPFFLARRGSCSFVQKVRNMENIGAAVAIIVDNRYEMTDEIIMSDDGTGGGIRIPSMLIGEYDGDKLINWLNSATEEEKSQVVLMSDFVLPETTVVKFDFWFTSSSDRGLDFLEDFGSTEEKFQDAVDFTPRYVFWECQSPMCDVSYTDKDCFGGGRYCAMESSNVNLSGRDIVLEDLRQMCIWDYAKEQNEQKIWWNYISELHKKCYSVPNEDCSQRAHNTIGISWEVTKNCVKNSFTDPDETKWGLASVSNTKIDEHISYWKQYGTNIYPSITIN